MVWTVETVESGGNERLPRSSPPDEIECALRAAATQHDIPAYNTASYAPLPSLRARPDRGRRNSGTPKKREKKDFSLWRRSYMARSYHNDLADLAAARYDRIARGNAGPAQDDPTDHLDGSGEDQDRWEGVRGREGPGLVFFSS